MYGAMKRHEIQVLKKAGHSHGRTADVAGVSKSTVQRVAKEPVVESATKMPPRGVGRPSKVEAFAPLLKGILLKEPELPTLEVLHRAKEAGYTGGKSALYALVKRMRPSREVPIVRFEGLPGEFSQHDFGSVDVRYTDGREERIHFFASR